MNYTRSVAAAIVCLATPAVALAQPFADQATMPPIAGESRLAATIHAMPQSEAGSYAASVERVHVIDSFAGLNGVLRQEDTEFKMLRIGRGIELSWDAETLFDAGTPDGGYTAYSAALVSIDAFGLRVRVDLSALSEGDEVWIVDPNGPRAFGPYTLRDHVDGGKWLPTIGGDTAVLVARTTADARPEVAVTGLTHIYREFNEAAKELSCNINIACEGNSTLLSAATGVGIMVIAFGGGDAALCSGALINNPDTSVFEPYYLTSWHCVPEAANANQIDVVWDFRASACGANDPPSLAVLPRSSGVALLETNSALDISLLQLDQVPSGPFGRTFLGWDAATPQVTNAIAGIHHPDGAHMRISKGTIEATNENAGSFQNQTKVHWAEGVTEAGSSGNPLLLASSNYRIIGTLSNGPFHSCGDNTGNVDWYSSFRDFFPEVEPYLKNASPPPPPSGGCAATKAFNGDTKALDELRVFRDEFLAATAPGKLAVALYYRTSPYLAPWVERSPMAATAFRAAAKPFAYAGSKLR